ncbi:hypothetical protein [Romboutsia maritimum]|nr:hypothetical protein [Romboutsia maritimum]
MDFKDILCIFGLLAFLVIGDKFWPNNPLNLIVRYLKGLFINKQ